MCHVSSIREAESNARHVVGLVTVADQPYAWAREGSFCKLVMSDSQLTGCSVVDQANQESLVCHLKKALQSFRNSIPQNLIQRSDSLRQT
jgi:hypothetical protein